MTLVGNNAPDVGWITDSERKFKQTKGSINYTMRIYVDVPYDADELLRKAVRKLNEMRPLNQKDLQLHSDQEKKDIKIAKTNLLFLWVRYWCLKCIDRKTNVPSFVTTEPIYKIFFQNIMNEYYRIHSEEDPPIFEKFKVRLNSVAFEMGRMTKHFGMKYYTNCI